MWVVTRWVPSDTHVGMSEGAPMTSQADAVRFVTDQSNRSATGDCWRGESTRPSFG